MACRYVRVSRFSFNASVNPISVEALEHVFEMDLFRRQKAETREVKFEPVFAGWYFALPGTDRLIVRDDLLNHHWRSQSINLESRRVHDGDTLDCREPNSAITGLTACRLKASLAFAALHSISDTIRHRYNRGPLSAGHIIQVLLANPIQALIAAHPQV